MNKLIDTCASIGYTLILFLILGCASERTRGLLPEELEGASLSLQLAVCASPQMRAESEAGDDQLHENKIERVKILFYRSGSLYWSVNPSVSPDGRYNIPVPADKRGGFTGTETYNVYVVTNCSTLSNVQQENDLKRLIITSAISEEQPSSFVMYGKVCKQINLSTADGKKLGEIPLQRIASKLRITPRVSIEGYTQQGEIQVKLMNAIDRGYLIEESQPNNAQAIPYDFRTIRDGKAHFYSYYKDWRSATDEGPYFLIAAPLQAETASAPQLYYYKVPLMPREARLVANRLYALTVRINKIGASIPEEPVQVGGQLSILDWSVREDSYDLPNANYLAVSEHTVHMHNIDTYRISYRSSKMPISIQINDVSYNYVDQNGQEKSDKISQGNPYYPSIRDLHILTGLDQVERTIEIKSKVPDNNVPKKIVFTITNGVAGLHKRVTVYQYPAQYITYTMGVKSSRRPDGTLAGSHLNNKAIYRITVQSPPEGMILGFPPTERWNHEHPVDKKHSEWVLHEITKNDRETSNMVSPSFELASQLGATQIMPYKGWGDWEEEDRSLKKGKKKWKWRRGAACHCDDYWEERYVNGRLERLEDWRLPTEAEIQLVDELQHRRNGVVKSIMTGNYYWDAYESNGATEMKRPDKKTGNYGSKDKAYVRCVRDVKENTLQVKVPYRLEP